MWLVGWSIWQIMPHATVSCGSRIGIKDREVSKFVSEHRSGFLWLKKRLARKWILRWAIVGSILCKNKFQHEYLASLRTRVLESTSWRIRNYMRSILFRCFSKLIQRIMKILYSCTDLNCLLLQPFFSKLSTRQLICRTVDNNAWKYTRRVSVRCDTRWGCERIQELLYFDLLQAHSFKIANLSRSHRPYVIHAERNLKGCNDW